MWTCATRRVLAPPAGLLTGVLPPTDLIEVRETGFAFSSIYRRAKTGHYLDSARTGGGLRLYCAGAEVLSTFSYTGSLRFMRWPPALRHRCRYVAGGVAALRAQPGAQRLRP